MTSQLGIGRVWLVGAGPGDPDLITVKGLRVLREADLVLYDRLAPQQLLDEAKATAELIDVGKHPGRPTPSQPWINGLIVEHALRGRNVVRLKGGDPCVFGRGGEEAIACAAAGVSCEIIPGVTAALGAAASAGVPVTHRGVSASVAFVTAITDWECEANQPGVEQQIEHAAAADTVCIYMGLAELPHVARRLMELGKCGDTPVLAVSKATTDQQREVVGTLADIAESVASAGLSSPVMTIVGPVVALRDSIRLATNIASEVRS
jgi:uroporphyrin-III C-methyltransferase